MSEIFRHTKKCCLKFFRKLSISNIKSTSGTASSECNAKYKPQKNHSIALSPLASKVKNRKKNRKKQQQQQQEDYDDDLSINSSSKHRKSYIKNCIKTKLNKNYEKQVNCINDENIVFTDNKIYISLSHRRSSINSSFGASSTSSRLKDRRVIYPSSGSYKLTGFLKDYDFNYDYKSDEDQKSEQNEKLKFNIMRSSSNSTPLPMSPLSNVVFEKVRYDKSKKYLSREEEDEEENRRRKMQYSLSSTEQDNRDSFYLDPFLDFSDNNDSLMTNTTFIAEWGNFQDCQHEDEEDDEDDIQWRNFIEIRKQQHSNPFNSDTNNKSSDNNNDSNSNNKFCNSSSDDSGIGRSSNDINRNLKSLETWLDDENFDNSFNEELERRVCIEVPQFYQNSNSSSAYYDNVNNNNHCTDKFS